MKVGDALSIEFMPFVVEHIGRGRVVLRRTRRLSLRQFQTRLKARRWQRPSVSANFFVDKKTNQTIDTYQLLALGITSKRIERLHQTLPLVEAP